MEYYCYGWAVALHSYLNMLDKLQDCVYRSVGTTLSASRGLLAFHGNVASLSIFCKYYLRRCLS